MAVIRVVLAVLLSTAIIGVALPAAETARSQRAATLVADGARDFGATIDRFVRRNDAVPLGVRGATHHTVVRVPTTTVIRIRDGELSWTRRNLSHRVPTAVLLVGDLTLRPGSHRVQLSLHRRGDTVVVRVRGFKSEAAATPSRVRNSFGTREVPM